MYYFPFKKTERGLSDIKLRARSRYMDKQVDVNRAKFKLECARTYLKLILIAVPVFLLLVAYTPAQAVERDYLGIPVTSNALAYTAGGLILIDWAQTLQIQERDDLYETNSWLGRQPSRGKVNRYFLMKLAGHVLVNRLPVLRKLKNVWNIYQIGITFDAVRGNYKLGLRIEL